MRRLKKKKLQIDINDYPINILIGYLAAFIVV